MSCDVVKVSSGKYYCNTHRCYCDMSICRYDQENKPFDFMKYAMEQFNGFGEVFCQNQKELWDVIVHLGRYTEQNKYMVEYRYGGVFLKKIDS